MCIRDRTRAHLVHRLDRETSGCLIFARSTEIRDMLQEQFKDRSIERIYHAVVHRKPPTNSGIETGRIQEMKDKRMRLVPEGRRAGKSAITNWWLEDTGPKQKYEKTWYLLRLDLSLLKEVPLVY